MVAAFKMRIVWLDDLFFLIEYSLPISQKSQNIGLCQKELPVGNKCLRSVERNFKFTISKSSAGFAALSASLFPCIPTWLGIQQQLTILP